MRAIDADAITYESIDSSDTGRHEHYYGTGIIAVRKEDIDAMPTIQPEIVRCKDCQYWNKGSCECPEHAVNCQDYYVGDIETEAEYFCGYAERREVTT